MTHSFDQSIDIRQLPKGGKVISLVAGDDECRALEDRLQLRCVDNVAADLTLSSLGSRAGVQLTGSLRADIVQACVVTLEDVADHIEEELAVRFVEDVHAASNTTDDIDPEEDDIEHFSGDFIEISEVVVQYLALAIDPYPRAESVQESPESVYSSGSGANWDVEEKPHPFAELKKLKDKT